MRRSEIESRPIAHVELQPMIDIGDHSVMTLFEDAEFFNVCFAPAGVPAIWDRSFESIDSALKYIFSKSKFANSVCWYNGNEIMQEITNKENPFFAICDSEFYEEEGLADIGEKLGYAYQNIGALIANAV